jgi:CheY-like chemotaxis protein
MGGLGRLCAPRVQTRFLALYNIDILPADSHFAGLGRGGSLLVGIGNRGRLIVILAGINLPDMDDLTLLREIYQQRCSDLPAMTVTAYGDDERRHRAREA